MAITKYTNKGDFDDIVQKTNSVLNLPRTYFDNVVGILGLKAKNNVVEGSRPFQQNVNDLKDFFPVVIRSDHFKKWQYRYQATVGTTPGKIVLYPYYQNSYEYLQIKFEEVAQELKRTLEVNDYLIIIKKINSPVYDLHRIPNNRNPYGNVEEFLAIYNSGNDSTFFDAPAIEINVSEREYPLNQILYGPPGTGKTHNAINHALAIATGKDLQELINAEKANPANRRAAKDEFDELVKSGQIQFVTFHQSYSYEEFVEGIKPRVNGSNVEYSIEDGIFKKICNIAGASVIEVGDKFTNSRSNNFTVSKVNSEVIEITREDGQIVTFPKGLITDLYRLISEGKINLDNVNSREANGQHLQELTSVKWDKYIFGYDGVLKPLLEFIIANKERRSEKNFVLIIDEINRGNISKIFGELITLIEESKRIGAPEELRVKLTYSGSEGDKMFGVPSNLYIIGTMNSADKSIALIDTALRRRFTFSEYTSDPSTLNDEIEGINLKLMLKKMNERIEFLLDKDHLLGHAYFLEVKTKNDLCGVFRNKIIPLLEEYFFGNYEKIQQVLGDNSGWKKIEEHKLIQEKKASTTTALFGNAEYFDDKIIYQVNPKIVEGKFDDITSEVFTSIYTKK